MILHSFLFSREIKKVSEAALLKPFLFFTVLKRGVFLLMRGLRLLLSTLAGEFPGIASFPLQLPLIAGLPVVLAVEVFLKVVPVLVAHEERQLVERLP